jgi:uncharacterized protein
MITELSAGFVIGLVGSVHCIGMCGPIAVALPVYQRSGWKLLFGRLLYNGGRVVTYMMFGAMAGVIGQRFAVAGFQQEVSIAVGSLMILTALAPGIMNRFWMKVPFTQKLNVYLKKMFAAAFQKRTLASQLAIGVVNGLLPCGLVYMAMAGSAATGSTSGGVAFMAGFGAGTIPVMLGVSVAGSLLPAAVRRRLSRWAPAFILVLGMIIVLRGLNLGIPMVSPKIPVHTAAQVPPACCGL